MRTKLETDTAITKLESDVHILKSGLLMLEKMIEGNKHLDDARFKALEARVLDLEKRP
jgi:hypothetical protein